MKNNIGQNNTKQYPESQIDEQKLTDYNQSNILYQHVISRLNHNIHPSQIEKELINMGFVITDTKKIIKNAEKDISILQEKEQFSIHTFLFSILGAVTNFDLEAPSLTITQQ